MELFRESNEIGVLHNKICKPAKYIEELLEK